MTATTELFTIRPATVEVDANQFRQILAAYNARLLKTDLVGAEPYSRTKVAVIIDDVPQFFTIVGTENWRYKTSLVWLMNGAEVVAIKREPGQDEFEALPVQAIAKMPGKAHARNWSLLFDALCAFE